MSSPQVSWDDENLKRNPAAQVKWDDEPRAEQPGMIARASEAIGLTQHPMAQLGNEVSQFIHHPIDTTVQTIKQTATGLRDTANNLSPIKIDDSGSPHLNNPLTAARDMVGGQRFAEDVKNKDYMGAAGTLIGDAAPFAAPVIGGKVSSMAKSALAPTIATPEVAARSLAKSINPPVQDWPNFMKSMEGEGGNVKDFALRKNVPLKTQLDFASAARGAGEEASAHFKTNVLDRVAGDQVSIAGTGYKGSVVGEGQRATLGDVYSRIRQINDELRPAFAQRSGGKVMTAIANEAELNAEKTALTNLFDQEASRRVGIKPEEMIELRRPSAQRFSLADKTEEAMNQRQSSAGKASEGRRDFPINVVGTIAELGNKYVRGGPEGIANRAFRKSMSRSNFPVTEAPQIAGPQEAASTPRTPIWVRGGNFPPSPLENDTFSMAGPSEGESARQAVAEQNRSTKRTSRFSNDIEAEARAVEAEAKRKKIIASHGKIGR